MSDGDLQPTDAVASQGEADGGQEVKATESATNGEASPAKTESATGTHQSAIDHTIRVYISSVSVDRNLKHEQAKMIAVLDAKKIPYEKVDVANNKARLRKMRQMANNEMTARPPQIFNGNQYLGDYETFLEAVDDEELKKFLRI